MRIARFCAIIIFIISPSTGGQAEPFRYEAKRPTSEKVYKLISMICPETDTGTIVTVRKNIDGVMVKTKVTYQPEGILVVLESAPYGSTFQETHRGIPDPNRTDEDNMVLVNGEKQARALKNKICDNSDPEVRKRFAVITEANRRVLESAHPTDHSSTTHRN